jgi:hypothetical protein
VRAQVIQPETWRCVASPPILSCPGPTRAVPDPVISVSCNIPARTVTTSIIPSSNKESFITPLNRS